MTEAQEYLFEALELIYSKKGDRNGKNFVKQKKFS